MILIFSDLHLGRFKDQDASLLTDIESCLNKYSVKPSTQLEEVIFLGDVFDSFMEYPSNISGYALQFSGLLKTLLKKGINVSYHVGNHDPWHSSFFSGILGNNLYFAPVRRKLSSRQAYLSHGDEASTYNYRGRIARYFMRSTFWYRTYTTVLPSTAGQKIPAWISRKFAGLEPRQKTIDNLKYAAHEILGNSNVDLVLFGHAHQSVSELTSDGQYVNTGSWLLSRSYVEISEESVNIRLYSNERPSAS